MQSERDWFRQCRKYPVKYTPPPAVALATDKPKFDVILDMLCDENQWLHILSIIELLDDDHVDQGRTVETEEMPQDAQLKWRLVEKFEKQ